MLELVHSDRLALVLGMALDAADAWGERGVVVKV